MPNIRKGQTIGKRRPHAQAYQWLTHAGIEDCRQYAHRATREELIDAHRWCERNPEGNKTRKGLIAAALRRLERQLEGGGR
jgi:hypothetical protein